VDQRTTNEWVIALGVAALLLQGLSTWYQYQELQIAKAP
jgi:hypothetical protein